MLFKTQNKMKCSKRKRRGGDIFNNTPAVMMPRDKMTFANKMKTSKRKLDLNGHFKIVSLIRGNLQLKDIEGEKIQSLLYTTDLTAYKHSSSEKFSYILGKYMNGGKSYRQILLKYFSDRMLFLLPSLKEDLTTATSLTSKTLYGTINCSEAYKSCLFEQIEKLKTPIIKDVPDKTTDDFIPTRTNDLNEPQKLENHNYVDDETRFVYDEYCSILGDKMGQYIPVKDTPDEFDFSRIKGNPYGVNKIVLKGGGAKGMVYNGVLMGLFSSGVLFYLDEYVGTSVGSLYTICFSCITPTKDEFDKIKNKSIREIVNFHSKVYEKYRKAVSFTIDMLLNQNIEELLDMTSIKNLEKAVGQFSSIHSMGDMIKNIFNIATSLKNTGTVIENLRDTHALIGATNFLKFMCNLFKEICKIMGNGLDEYITETELFTFKQYNEHTGKNLIVVATDTKNFKSVYFSSKNTKFENIKVHRCMLSSMAIPFIFAPQDIDDTIYFDGGFYENCAINYDDQYLEDGSIGGFNKKVFGFTLDKPGRQHYEVLRNILLGMIEMNKLHDHFLLFIYNDDSKTYNEVKVNKLFTKFAEMRKQLVQHDLIDTYEKEIEGVVLKSVTIHSSVEQKGIWLRYYLDTRFINYKIQNILGREDSNVILNLKNLLLESLDSNEVNSELTSLLDKLNTTCDEHVKVCSISRYDINQSVKRLPIESFSGHVENAKNLLSIVTQIDELIKKSDYSEAVKTSCQNLLDEVVVYQNELYYVRLWKKAQFTEDTILFNSEIIKEESVNIINNLCDIIAKLAVITSFVEEEQLKQNEHPTELNVKYVESTLEHRSIIGKAVDRTVEITGNMYKKASLGLRYLLGAVSGLVAVTSATVSAATGYTAIKATQLTARLTKTDLDSFTQIPEYASKLVDVIKFFADQELISIIGDFLNIIDDKIKHEPFNAQRVIRLNVMEADVLSFGLSKELKIPVVMEGYQKTIKYFSKILCIQEITGKLVNNEITYVPTHRLAQHIEVETRARGGVNKKSKRKQCRKKTLRL